MIWRVCESHVMCTSRLWEADGGHGSSILLILQPASILQRTEAETQNIPQKQEPTQQQRVPHSLASNTQSMLIIQENKKHRDANRGRLWFVPMCVVKGRTGGGKRPADKTMKTHAHTGKTRKHGWCIHLEINLKTHDARFKTAQTERNADFFRGFVLNSAPLSIPAPASPSSYRNNTRHWSDNKKQKEQTCASKSCRSRCFYLKNKPLVVRWWWWASLLWSQH